MSRKIPSKKHTLSGNSLKCSQKTEMFSLFIIDYECFLQCALLSLEKIHISIVLYYSGLSQIKARVRKHVIYL